VDDREHGFDAAPRAAGNAPRAPERAPRAADRAPRAADRAPRAADRAPRAADRAKPSNIARQNRDGKVRRHISAVSANHTSVTNSSEVKRRKAWPEDRVAAIAAEQRALITRQQLISLGAGRDAIRRALQRGRIHQLHRGVYATVPASVLPPLAAEQAAVLACGPGAYLSHHSAAAAWGFRPPVDGHIDVLVVGRRPSPRAGLRIHRTPSIDPRDTRNRAGIAITSPARTLIDIACELSDREFERAFDEALAIRALTLAAARAALLANSRRPGASLTRALVCAERATTMTRSEAEEAFLVLVRRSGLPLPEVNARVGRFEVDFCWRRERVIVEIDGYAFHSSQAALERDHERDVELQQMGFLVIRISWRELRYEQEKVLVRVASALARRAA
jgi:very-short-patch-repair endonuclease